MTFTEHNSLTLLHLGGDVTFPEHNSVTLLHLGGASECFTYSLTHESQLMGFQ